RQGFRAGPPERPPGSWRALQAHGRPSERKLPLVHRFLGNRMNRNESSDDYLEAILRIRSERGSCRNVDIAERLGVSKASVTKALGNLARRGLAEVVGRDVRLTDEGGRLA